MRGENPHADGGKIPAGLFVMRRGRAQRWPFSTVLAGDPQKGSISVACHFENRQRLQEENSGGAHPAAHLVSGGRRVENRGDRSLVDLHDMHQSGTRFKAGAAKLIRMGETRLAAAADVIEQRSVINGK